MRTVRPMRESKKIENDSKWKEAYSAVLLAYQNVQPMFSLCHDSFGGYRLVYKGESVIYPPKVLRMNPIGFVREVPEGVVKNLSIMSSERTGKDFLLLGPVRFVNSDCDPNREYELSSESGIIQLRVKKRIKPGDEINVKYGPDFFDHNSCLCRTCQVRLMMENRVLTTFDVVLDHVILELSKEVLDESLREQTPATPPSDACRAKF